MNRAFSSLLLIPVLLMTMWTMKEAHQRARLGVDFTDEGFYVSLPYRFALGDSLFRDEIAIHQTAAIITYPAVKAFVDFKGGSDGLVLFTRRLFLVIAWSVAAAVFFCSQKSLGSPAAAMLGTFSGAFAGIPISNVSYNTLATALLSLALFICVWTKQRMSWRAAAFSGVFLGLAATAYPTLAVAGPFALAFLWIGRHEKPKITFTFVAGVITGLLPIATVILVVGPEHVLDAIVLTNSSAPKAGGVGKIQLILGYLWALLPIWPCVLIVAAFAISGPISQIRKGLPFLELGVVAWVGSGVWQTGSPRPILEWIPYLVAFGFLAPALAISRWQIPMAKFLLAGVWLPSFFCGLATAFTSSEGARSFVVGGFPMTLASLAMAFLPHPQMGGAFEVWARQLVKATLLGIIGIGVMGGTISRKNYFYRDGSLTELVVEVPRGAYAGMKTITSKAAFLADLQADLDRIVPQDAKIIFYNDFPSGFLLSKRRSAICGSWVYTRGAETNYRSLYTDCVKRMAEERTYIVQVLKDTRTVDLQPAIPIPGDPFNEMMERCRFEDLVQSPSYRIAQLNLGCLNE